MHHFPEQIILYVSNRWKKLFCLFKYKLLSVLCIRLNIGKYSVLCITCSVLALLVVFQTVQAPSILWSVCFCLRFREIWRNNTSYLSFIVPFNFSARNSGLELQRQKHKHGFDREQTPSLYTVICKVQTVSQFSLKNVVWTVCQAGWWLWA